jgi:hypothetical protein
MIRMAFFWLALLPASLPGQAPALNALEKEFQDSMAGVALEGQSTYDGKPGVADDRYNIEKVEKGAGDNWTFFVRVNRQGKEMTLPLPIEVKWAGDTPVITLTEKPLPGMGTYTARVVVYKGNYAGTWSGRNGGGKVFGKIVKK